MNIFNLLFCWKLVILKLSQKHKGPSRSLHVVLNKNPVLLEEYLNGELGQPKIYRAKIKLVKESFKLSIVIQASYKHCWKSQSGYPWASQNPRENTFFFKEKKNFNIPLVKFNLQVLVVQMLDGKSTWQITLQQITTTETNLLLCYLLDNIVCRARSVLCLNHS